MQSKLKKTSLIFSIIIFLFFCASIFFLYMEIEKNNKVLKELEVDLQNGMSKRLEIKNFNDSFKSIEQDKILLETHFVQSSDIVPFLNTIEKMASSVGTEAEVSFLEIAKDNSGLILYMKDKGTFEQVYKFILLLENSPYELEFTSVEMQSVSNQEDIKNKKDLWEVNLKIKLISFT